MAQKQLEPDEQPHDLVDVFYIPLVRPLGNLVILVAQAEAALVDLLMALNGEDENLAHHTLKGDAKKQVTELVQSAAKLTGFDLTELLEGLDAYWADRDRRNRYIHDEWWVGQYDTGALPSTRGIPRKKGSAVVFDEPTPDDIWALARNFREHSNLFSHRAWVLRKPSPEGGLARQR